MTTSEQIRVLCVRSGVSLSELARRINQTPQNFSVKLKRNTVTQDELNQIANVLNVKYEQYFVLANGDQVKYLSAAFGSAMITSVYSASTTGRRERRHWRSSLRSGTSSTVLAF